MPKAKTKRLKKTDHLNKQPESDIIVNKRVCPDLAKEVSRGNVTVRCAEVWAYLKYTLSMCVLFCQVVTLFLPKRGAFCQFNFNIFVHLVSVLDPPNSVRKCSSAVCKTNLNIKRMFYK